MRLARLAERGHPASTACSRRCGRRRRFARKQHEYLLNSSINIQINTLGPVSGGGRSHLATAGLWLGLFPASNRAENKAQPHQAEPPLPGSLVSLLLCVPLHSHSGEVPPLTCTHFAVSPSLCHLLLVVLPSASSCLGQAGLRLQMLSRSALSIPMATAPFCSRAGSCGLAGTHAAPSSTH